MEGGECSALAEKEAAAGGTTGGLESTDVLVLACKVLGSTVEEGVVDWTEGVRGTAGVM